MKGLQQEANVAKRLKPVAVFSSHGIEEPEDQFIAIAEGVDLPIYAFTYAIEMT